MTADEHEAARACGLVIERGMTVTWPNAIGDRYARGLVRLVSRDGQAVGVADSWQETMLPASACAPDLSDPATYRAGLAQWLRRRSPTGHPSINDADAVAYMLLAPDPARLAALLRESAPKED